MTEKCILCKEKIETTFLEKLVGTYVKKKPVCRNCQKRYGEKLKLEIK